MGNHQGHVQDEEFVSACRKFTEAELQDINRLYRSLAAQSKSNGQYVTASVFQAYFQIHGSLAARAFDLATQLRKDQQLLYKDFVIFKAKYEKGDPEEIEKMIYQLLDLNGNGIVERIEVESVVLSILESVLGPADAFPGAVPENVIQAFLGYADFAETASGSCMSIESFRKWCMLVPSVRKFLVGLLQAPEGTRLWQVPQLLSPDDMHGKTVLRKEHAWHISGLLQLQEAENWVLLYNSSKDGLSFNTFLNNVGVAQGSTILVVKDKEDCIYGGYASQPWERHTDFYGDMKSFLFTLQPQAALYRPSGTNTNLQWCAYNFTSESIPNGIGFGGQIKHFGLFLSASFDHGHTRHSATFCNPPLSTKPEIIPDIIECWGILVKGDGDPNGIQRGLKGTILERFKEDRNMLNMVGVANASDSI